MKKKNPKDQQKNKKPPQNVSLFIPQQYISFLQEDSPLICPEERSKNIRKYHPEVEPFDIPLEWEEKAEEEINQELLVNEENNREKETLQSKKSSQHLKIDKNFKKRKSIQIKSDNSSKNNTSTISNNNENTEGDKPKKIYQKWKDPMHDELINNLPLSFIKMTENNIKWLSPEEYILNEKLDEKIKRIYPKRNYIQMREDIKEFFKEIRKKEEEKQREKERIEKERLEKERLEKEIKEKEIKAKKRIIKRISKLKQAVNNCSFGLNKNEIKEYVVNFKNIVKEKVQEIHVLIDEIKYNLGNYLALKIEDDMIDDKNKIFESKEEELTKALLENESLKIQNENLVNENLIISQFLNDNKNKKY